VGDSKTRNFRDVGLLGLQKTDENAWSMIISNKGITGLHLVRVRHFNFTRFSTHLPYLLEYYFQNVNTHYIQLNSNSPRITDVKL
jgi:hypothetical protein